MTYHEGGGGAAVELFAAQGAKTGFDADFRLIGTPPEAPKVVPGIVDEVFAAVVKRTDGVELTELVQARELLANPGASEVFVGTAPYVAHGDPENGAREFAFPGLDNGIDDDDFASRFQGFIDVTEDGEYVFNFQTDDNAQLTILGADFTLVGSANMEATSLSEDGQTVFADFLTGNSNTTVSTFLAAGKYPFDFIQLERGGGANATLLVEASGGFIPLGSVPAGTITMDPGGLQLVPEPSSLLLAMLGLIGVLASGRRRRRA
jgi:hypothetical protein